jgi:SAM-dependent methyltransferase
MGGCRAERQAGKQQEGVPAQGISTAAPENVAYRLQALSSLLTIRGIWLDCGCAEGGYAAALAGKGPSAVAGLDLDAARLVEASHSAPTGVGFACAASEALPFIEGSISGVWMNEVLEHVSDEARTLTEIRRVLQPGGYLALASPNRWCPIEGHGMAWRGREIESPVPLLPWLPARLTRSHLRARNYWPHELRALVEQARFVVLQCRSLFPVFAVYRLLPRGVASSYRRLIPVLERLSVIRKMGVSTLILAQKPGE